MAETDIDYLTRTATPGGTMTRQGVRQSIERLHPAFRAAAAATVRAARAAGIKDAGIYSSYRAPSWGVGGFGNKKKSLHAYGAAVDFTGIGRPGSQTAKDFYDIATQNGIYNPYGPSNRAEWNHFQLVPTKSAPAEWQTAITGRPPKSDADLQAIWSATGVPFDGTALVSSQTRTPPASVSPLGSRTLRYKAINPMRGEDIRALQKQLISSGFDVGKYGADGVYGTGTVAAVKKFQTAYNEARARAGLAPIDVDGVVGTDTREPMVRAMEAQRANLPGVARYNATTAKPSFMEVFGAAKDKLIANPAEAVAQAAYTEADMRQNAIQNLRGGLLAGSVPSQRGTPTPFDMAQRTPDTPARPLGASVASQVPDRPVSPLAPAPGVSRRNLAMTAPQAGASNPTMLSKEDFLRSVMPDVQPGMVRPNAPSVAGNQISTRAQFPQASAIEAAKQSIRDQFGRPQIDPRQVGVDPRNLPVEAGTGGGVFNRPAYTEAEARQNAIQNLRGNLLAGSGAPVAMGVSAQPQGPAASFMRGWEGIPHAPDRNDDRTNVTPPPGILGTVHEGLGNASDAIRDFLGMNYAPTERRPGTMINNTPVSTPARSISDMVRAAGGRQGSIGMGISARPLAAAIPSASVALNIGRSSNAPRRVPTAPVRAVESRQVTGSPMTPSGHSRTTISAYSRGAPAQSISSAPSAVSTRSISDMVRAAPKAAAASAVPGTPPAPGVARYNALAASAPKVPYRGPPPAMPSAQPQAPLNVTVPVQAPAVVPSAPFGVTAAPPPASAMAPASRFFGSGGGRGFGGNSSVAAQNARVAANVRASDRIGGNAGSASYGRRQSDGSVTGTTSRGTGYTSRNGGRDISVGGKTYRANKNNRGYSRVF